MDNQNQNNTSTTEDSVFLIRVQFRRNTSWQGTLQSMNSRKSCIFRSVLEMGYLIYNERLTALGLDGEEGSQLPSWDTKEEVS
jgi:hypothetical protein